VSISGDVLHIHPICTFNYTTYDQRRESDTVRSANLAGGFVVLAANDLEPNFPFWLARVNLIFHVNVCARLPCGKYTSKRLDVLFINYYHFYKRDDWTPRRLPSFTFGSICGPSGRSVPDSAFLDPARVIRGAHVVPAFEAGHAASESVYPTSILPRLDGQAWESFYLNLSVLHD
jgi:hypothetical protein